MDGKWFGHIIFFGRFQKTNQILSGRVFVMMATVTGIGLLVQAAGFQGELGEHESEGVTMRVTGFANARYPGHVTAHTTAKSVNAVYRAVLICRVAAFTKLVLKQACLGTDDDQRVGHFTDGLQSTLASVDIVTSDAGHTHFGMFALLPVEILLVAVSGFSARPK
jgi:hypothetical protein